MATVDVADDGDIKHSVFPVVNVVKTNEWICEGLRVYPADSCWRKEEEAKHYLTKSVDQTHFSVADLAGSQSPTAVHGGRNRLWPNRLWPNRFWPKLRF